MFRDTEEELQRLQDALLTQEAPVQEDIEQDSCNEDDSFEYQNFSNDYGKAPSGYKVYNTDKVDVDPEELSRQLLAPKRHTGLLITAALLSMAVLALVCYLLLRYGRVLS